MDSAKDTKITAIAASHGVNSFYLFFLTPIIPIIATEFNLNYVEVGIIASLYAFANGIFQFPISFLGDYLGRWRTVLTISLLVQSIPVFLYGISPTYGVFLIFVFFSGLGCSAYHPPAIALITRESPERRGFIMAIFAGGGDVGSIITPVLVGWMTVYFASWRMAAHLALIPGVIMAIIIWRLFEDIPRDDRSMKQAASATLGALVRNKPLILLILLSTFRITGFRGLMTFLPLLLAQNFGFDTQSVGWTISSYFIMGTLTTIIVGRWSDKGSKTMFILVLTLFCGLALASISLATTTLGVICAIISVGVLLTPVPSLVLAVGTELVEERQRASAIGLVYAINEGASTISPLIGGLVAEAVSLRFSFLFYAVLFGISSVIAFILHQVSKNLDTPRPESAA
ncbi:MAG: MFS transporter [Nitrospinaceae bacterium]|jgi:MFS family permease|nr:MFS transporter [Nitrospinaceae bacterium]MBT3433067.1 MFS transporter [Nitrospinaceae bacterium]MBT4095467.1 MFS transporter [Nitrospinaceae bacterium]MBT4430597.1 MFS transporter [Nitrospinaceae bacterium]MBT5367258.1 MFS transporter [Nitrospinaceae bacterium]